MSKSQKVEQSMTFDNERLMWVKLPEVGQSMTFNTVINRDPWRLLEVRELLNELDMLKAEAPHAFELMMDTSVIGHTLDEFQGLIDTIKDEARDNGELSA